MNTTFKRIISMALICMMMIGTLAGFSVSADEAATTVEIVSNNVQYGESLKLMYAVKAPAGSNVKVTITDAQGNVYNTVADGTVTVDGVECYKFVSEYGVPAQNIDAQFTATATVEGTEASDSQTYSVLQYLWHRLNVSTNTTDVQRAMYNALIEYAKAADVVLNKEAVSSIANLTYVVINGEGAMYNVGDEVELITDLVAGEGQEIVWTLNGETYTEATYVVTNAFANFVATVAGDVVEPEEPTPEEPEWTVADALEAEDGTVITLTATVESIYQAYNSSYNNISVYLTDASGASIIAFRLTGNVHIGDLITVTGTITTYEVTGVKQFAQGCTFEMVEEHNCAEYATEATCTMGSACSSCGEAVSDALGHADEDGDDLCDRCELNLNADYVPSWKLVTDLSQLKAGMQVVIATAPSTSLNFALGSDAGNYRKNVAITVNADGTLNVADGVEILTLVDGATDGSFGFQASNGYLYGLSGSNYLKTKNKLEADGSWTISISATGVATISANCGGTTRYIKYNDQSPRFSGYKSGQKDVCIYAFY